MMRTSKESIVKTACRSLFIFIVALTAGCGGPAPEENSGRDQGRGGAQTIALGAIVTDTVNFEGGDATDWKSFELSSAGPITVDLFWDNVNIGGTLSLHDQYGATLASVTHSPGNQHDQITTDAPGPGLYYVRIHTAQWKTTYSIRVYTGRPRELEQWQEEPRPEYERPL